MKDDRPQDLGACLLVAFTRLSSVVVSLVMTVVAFLLWED